MPPPPPHVTLVQPVCFSIYRVIADRGLSFTSHPVNTLNPEVVVETKRKSSIRLAVATKHCNPPPPSQAESGGPSHPAIGYGVPQVRVFVQGKLWEN